MQILRKQFIQMRVVEFKCLLFLFFFRLFLIILILLSVCCSGFRSNYFFDFWNSLLIGYTMFLLWFWVLNTWFSVESVSDNAFIELHDIACESSRFIWENILNLSEFFVDCCRHNFRRDLLRGAVHERIRCDEVTLDDFDHFKGNYQRDWDHRVVEQEVRKEVQNSKCAIRVDLRLVMQVPVSVEVVRVPKITEKCGEKWATDLQRENRENIQIHACFHVRCF